MRQDHQAAITVSSVTKYFRIERRRPLVACEDISFEVKPHELVCIIGPSGCGKSTLLRIIAGLAQADSGKVEIPREAKVSMIFQNAAIFPWLTVRDNIAFGLTMQKASHTKIERMVHEQLNAMGLEHAAHQHPKELSGGMKQRVGIARALAVEPDILLLDEPFSALDAFTAETLRQDVLRVWQSQKRTMLMITHLVEEAVEMADRIIVMTKRPGRVKAIVPVTLKRPRKVRSAEFYKLVDHVRDLVVSEHEQH